ncbi:rhomboid family protein [unidentified eubacterium SCB49]|nr:rhomboid family protein [unidentified eubacterium SCB49]
MGRITETVKWLIIINIVFFVGTLLYDNLAYRLFSLYYFENEQFQVWQPITHMFMHGGFAHILFNMYGLFAFGSPLEARWGTKKFLFFYFSAGIGAALVHTGVNYFTFHQGLEAMMNTGLTDTQVLEMMADSMRQVATNSAGQYSVNLPTGIDVDSYNNMLSAYSGTAVGASGAVYGVLVAFGLMFPNIELMLIFLPIPIKAKYFIPLMIAGDLFFGVTGSPFGIAHWAHIGGALFGFIMAYYWKRNSMNHTRWD